MERTALILTLYVLRASALATTGFPSVEEIGAPTIDTQVLPQSARPRFTVRQWIFPSMVFNCAGDITRWIFRAQETGLNNGMLPLISTWRDSRFTLPTTDFQRVSVSGSAEELTGDGPVYEYVLQEPVSVEEGDILGIGLPVNFRNMNEEQLDFEFLDLGDENAPDSYRRTFFGMSIDIAILATRFQPFGSTRDQQYVPLIAAVIGFPDDSTASTVFPTSTTPPTQSQTTPPQTDGSGLGSGLTQELTLAPGSVTVTPTPTTSTTPPTQSQTTPPQTDGSGLGSGLTQELTLAPGSVTVTPTPTTSPGNPLNVAAIVGPAIAVSVLVIFTIVVIVSAVMLIKRSHSKQKAGEPYESPDAVGMKENEAYGTNTQTQHIATAANQSYGCRGDIPVAENVAYIPATTNIPTVQNEACGKVSRAEVNTDTEEWVNVDEMYDYVNN